MIYIIFTLLHNLLDFLQVNLFKTAKHWDSFFTHCSITWFIRSNVTAPGYYIWSNHFQDYDAVEFFDTHWYRIFANEGSYFTCINDRIEPGAESTGYWRITDPQHPQYTAPPQHPPLPFSATGPSRLSERVRTPTPVLTEPREP